MGNLRLRSAPLRGNCPVCGAPFSATLGDAIDERQVACTNGHLIQLHDNNDGVRRGVGQAERDFVKLERSFKDLNRQLRRLSRRR
jgi:hypothetical protein